MIGCEVKDTVVEGCLVNNIQQLRECLAANENAILNQDITVGASDCDGNGVIDISNSDGLGIYGQGYRIFREGGQAQCSLIYGNGVSDFTIQDVLLEETPGPDVPPLSTYDNMLYFINSTNVCLENVEVAHSWGYAIYNRGGDGFKFNNSTLRDSGILGLYIGEENNPATNATITNSTFDCNSTNAIAIRGVDGLLIDNNLINDNHKLGIFPIPGGFTGGGQVFLFNGTNMVLSNNTIQNGFCQNCVNSGVIANPVVGIEIGASGLTVTNTLIENNNILNNTSLAMRKNTNAILNLTTVIRNNTLSGNGFNDAVSVAGADYTP